MYRSRDGGVQSSKGRETSGKTEPVPHSTSRTKRESKVRKSLIIIILCVSASCCTQVQSGDGPVAETAGETEGVGLGLGIVRGTYVYVYDRRTDRLINQVL